MAQVSGSPISQNRRAPSTSSRQAIGHGWMAQAAFPSPRPHGLIVKETAFELLAPHAVVDLIPIPPDAKVTLPLGLNT